MQAVGQVQHPVQSRRQSSPCLPKDDKCGQNKSRSEEETCSHTHEMAQHTAHTALRTTLQHTQAAIHCHLQQQRGCNKDVAGAVQLLIESNQQYKEVKASEIQLMRVSCNIQNATAAACDAVQMHISYQQLHVRAHLV